MVWLVIIQIMDVFLDFILMRLYITFIFVDIEHICGGDDDIHNLLCYHNKIVGCFRILPFSFVESESMQDTLTTCKLVNTTLR